MERANFFAIEVWNGIRSALRCRVDAILHDMLMELAVPCLDEGHSAPVRYAPKRRADYRANEISCTHAAQGRAAKEEKWVDTHDGLRRVQLHRAEVRRAAG